MKLTPVMQKFILHWGEMGTRWGVNRSVAQIHALLYLADTPTPADIISETLGIARSNVSNSLRELQNLGLVQIVHVLGDRRDHFDTKKDTWEILTTIADARKRRELDPTIEVLRQCVADLQKDKSTPKETRARIENMLEFSEEFSNWYIGIRELPNKTLMRLMRMGTKIGKLLAS